MTKKILYLDMDNVLVDFYSHPKHIIPRDSYNDPRIYMKGFFRNLEPTHGAIDTTLGFSNRSDLDVYILTHGLKGSPHCYSEKVEWVQEHMPWMIDRMIITCDKTLNKGDILVDDDIKWNGFEGKFIEFTPYSLLDYNLSTHIDDNVYNMMWSKVINMVNQECKL